MRKEMNIEIGVAGIIQKENGEIFLARSPKTNNGWTLPGGHLNPGETIKEAIEREVLEETGLIVAYDSILRVCEIINKEKDIHLISFHVLCRTAGGDVKIDNIELTEWKWEDLAIAINNIEMEDYKRTLKSFY